MADQSELMVLVFTRPDSATLVAEALHQMEREHIVDLHNVAVVERSAHGETSIHENNDLTTREGAVLGAVVGGVAGAFRHKVIEGALLGAGGGYVLSRLIDLGFDDATLRAIADSLKPNNSAAVVALEIKNIAEVARRLAPYGGTLVHDTLPGGQGARLAAAMLPGAPVPQVADAAPVPQVADAAGPSAKERGEWEI